MPGTPARNRRLRVNLDPEGIFPTQCVGRTENGPCRRPPVIGSPACHKHGSQLPGVRAAADRRVAEAAAERNLRATMERMNLDAEPVRDPTVALGTLAGRLLSGFEVNTTRVNAKIEAGDSPSDYDVAERKLLVRELRQVLTDMTRLQIGVSLGMQFIQKVDEKAQDGPLAGELDDGRVMALGPGSEPVADVSAIVSSVLEAEHRLETDRLVRLREAEAAAGGLRVVGDTPLGDDGQAASA